MEFNVKLQELRKQKGITQEELAKRLYVSRTAISKWESGRGYPSLDSLKAIARFFSVTVDELLSSNEVLAVAEEEQKRKQAHLRDLVFGLLDLCTSLLLFLPFFAEKEEGGVRSASLLSLVGVEAYVKTAYFAVVIGIAITGVMTLALQLCTARAWVKSKTPLSLLLGAASALLFMISLQPYAAVFAFSLLAVKATVLIKRQ